MKRKKGESKLPEELRIRRNKSAERMRRMRWKKEESKLPEELKIKVNKQTPMKLNRTKTERKEQEARNKRETEELIAERRKQEAMM